MPENNRIHHVLFLKLHAFALHLPKHVSISEGAIKKKKSNDCFNKHDESACSCGTPLWYQGSVLTKGCVQGGHIIKNTMWRRQHRTLRKLKCAYLHAQWEFLWVTLLIVASRASLAVGLSTEPYCPLVTLHNSFERLNFMTKICYPCNTAVAHPLISLENYMWQANKLDNMCFFQTFCLSCPFCWFRQLEQF